MSKETPPTRTRIHHKGVLESFKETIESLVVAFVLAFVFRAFVVEAFVIPTGSMADTLRGAHFDLLCRNCGYEYNFGFNPTDYVMTGTNRVYPKGYIPPEPIGVTPTRMRAARTGTPICPMCGCQADTEARQRVNNGDRILVLKYLYQFRDPQRWDVVVFKNPVDPQENYIKRLVGRPGEKLQIIDGDIYIDDMIQHKPDHVQDDLWIEVFNNDYQPAASTYRASNYPELWQQPFVLKSGPEQWVTDQPGGSFEFTGSAEPSMLQFNSNRMRYLLGGLCAYNGPRSDPIQFASDLKFGFVLTPNAEAGSVAITLGKYRRTYRAQITFDGTCTITDEQEDLVLAEEQFAPLQAGVPIEISFASIDHRLRITLGDSRLDYTGANSAEQWGYDSSWERPPVPSVALAGAGGRFKLDRVVLYRDILYTNYDSHGMGPGRATEPDGPFTLDEDEFFVCGDNSPYSSDSRFWNVPGKGNHGSSYRMGTVPREYLIGRALFVYWPRGFSLHPKVRFSLVPNVGDMRFIH